MSLIELGQMKYFEPSRRIRKNSDRSESYEIDLPRLDTNRNSIMQGIPKLPLKTLSLGSFFIFILHWLVKFEQVREHGSFYDLNIAVEKDFQPYGMKEPELFPVTGVRRIPKIIHQTWKDKMVPRKLTSWVKSWVKNHPDWEYWLWTDASAREMLADKYPWFLSTFDNYPENIRRADALRYFVLYEFGGVYADMDMESFKSIDPLSLKYSCFLGQEPYEHPVLDSNFEHIVINAIMGCRKNHPFMKKVMESLPDFSHMWNVLDSTGPHFLTLHYRQYQKNNLPPDVDDGVYLAPAEYFFPTIDPAKFFWMRTQCAKFDKLTNIQQKACKSLKVKGIKRTIPSISFATHHWIHTYLDLSITLKGPVEIHTVVPQVKIYKSSKTLS
ncbi:uncharacterized protein LOC106875328 [Octopus bimaculoides]|uniref:Uncharacterized protein n=1 Tax=Octopus bimaculoides TaxID=37653 RepID=A0A0L8GQY7_OCTBM|nr:uncharacterized protein LOC106875328 [Octopus bimaculoides]|eukprot:XP_014778903.1 PREDICTED: inositol phosphoceramide mannosyltransferase 2-like [Octopus bimaculoides]